MPIVNVVEENENQRLSLKRGLSDCFIEKNEPIGKVSAAQNSDRVSLDQDIQQTGGVTIASNDVVPHETREDDARVVIPDASNGGSDGDMTPEASEVSGGRTRTLKRKQNLCRGDLCERKSRVARRASMECCRRVYR